MILKPNMVVSAFWPVPHSAQSSRFELTDPRVPDPDRARRPMPGVAFLSAISTRGTSPSARLNAMNSRSRPKPPWALAFSFARAIQQPALQTWRGEDSQRITAQEALYHRALCNQAARRGDYTTAIEHGTTVSR